MRAASFEERSCESARRPCPRRRRSLPRARRELEAAGRARARAAELHDDETPAEGVEAVRAWPGGARRRASVRAAPVPPAPARSTGDGRRAAVDRRHHGRHPPRRRGTTPLRRERIDAAQAGGHLGHAAGQRAEFRPRACRRRLYHAKTAVRSLPRTVSASTACSTGRKTLTVPGRRLSVPPPRPGGAARTRSDRRARPGREHQERGEEEHAAALHPLPGQATAVVSAAEPRSVPGHDRADLERREVEPE